MEISVQGGVHLLAIFDPVTNSAAIASVLGGVGFPAHHHGETDDKNGAAITRNSLLHVIEEVQRCGGIAIPAHVDAAKRLLRLSPGSRSCALEAAMVKQVLQKPGLLALEWKANSAAYPSIWDELKPNLNSVVGGDCHTFQDSTVPGSRYTWIKMATPCLEGLRLALLDGQGVSVRRRDDGDDFQPLKRPEHCIESIEIQGAQFMGRSKPAVLACMRMFADRLELYSPGAIPNTMTVESLPYRQAARNEAVTSLLAKCPVPDGDQGFTGRSAMTDKRGEGVQIILDNSERLSGKRPIFSLVDESELMLVIPAAQPVDVGQ